MRRTLSTRVLALFAVAALTLGAAACGGDDDDDDDASGGNDDAPELTEAEFTEQGNAICDEMNTAIEEGTEEFSNPPTADEVEGWADDVLVPTISDVADQIGDLNAPEAIQGDVDEMLDILRTNVNELGDMSGDDLLDMLMGGEDPFTDANVIADELGLTSCSGSDG